MPLFVLLHSPLVGPATWSPVANRLARLGHEATVPSLLAVGDSGPPYWPAVVAAVMDGIAGAAAGEPLVLVAHSSAGVFVPVIRHALASPVACSVFADATLPAEAGDTPVVDTEFLAFLRGLAGPDGRLPRWTDWWPEKEVASLLPNRDAREVVTREQPRLPLAYFQERVPVPDGWDDHACWYLTFSAAYEGAARQAAGRGWSVRSLPGGHLHQLADPGGVASLLLDMAGQSPS